MDVALRTLREGRGKEGNAAPLLLFCGTLEAVGGPALLRKASCSGPCPTRWRPDYAPGDA